MLWLANSLLLLQSRVSTCTAASRFVHVMAAVSHPDTFADRPSTTSFLCVCSRMVGVQTKADAADPVTEAATSAPAQTASVGPAGLGGPAAAGSGNSEEKGCACMLMPSLSRDHELDGWNIVVRWCPGAPSPHDTPTTQFMIPRGPIVPDLMDSGSPDYGYSPSAHAEGNPRQLHESAAGRGDLRVHEQPLNPFANQVCCCLCGPPMQLLSKILPLMRLCMYMCHTRAVFRIFAAPPAQLL